MRRYISILILVLLLGALALFLFQQGYLSLGGRTIKIDPDPQATVGPTTTSDGSEIAVYFSRVYRHRPDEARADRESIDRQLVALLQRAERSIDAALHELDSATIAAALVRAHRREVTVRLVTDDSYLEEGPLLQVREAGVPVVGDDRRALMHNKFIVVDRRWVWTGSFNTTDNGAYKNNNNAVLIDSERLAANYIREFEEMFSEHRFGPRSPADTPYPLVQLDNVLVENYFAPEEAVTEEIVAELGDAQRSIHFLAFSFTSDEIGEAMVERFQQGVEVQGVFERRQNRAPYSEYYRMEPLGIEVREDCNPWNMHHKVIIIDHETVITGSFNFSANAARSNDENILIIHSSEVARQFESEFRRLYTGCLPPDRS